MEARYLRTGRDCIYLKSGGVVYPGQKVILVDGENSGEVFSASIKGYMGSTFKVLNLNPYIFDEYILLFLKLHQPDYRNNKKGSAIPHLDKNIFFGTLFPLPPLEEQKRIVARVNELTPLINEYEKVCLRMEQLNTKFPEDLEKSILQYAIQGKLVDQLPEEGTGADLYNDIQIEKRNLIKSGQIKVKKTIDAPVEDQEKPFEIPSTWKWVRLQDIGELNRGRSKHRPRNDPILFREGKYPFIQTGDVAQTDYHITTFSSLYSEEGLRQSRMWPKGTLCLTIAANIGDVAILDFDACFPDSVVGFNAYAPISDNSFFLYGLMCYKTLLDKMSHSTAQKNINLEILSKIAFPLPPLGEQRRIVARLNELLPLCKLLVKDKK